MIERIDIKTKKKDTKKYSLIYISLFWILPAFSIVGLYPKMLSFHIYTGNLDGPYITNVENKKVIQNSNNTKVKDTICIGLMSYSMDERGIPYYPIYRVVDSVFQRINRQTKENLQLVYNKPDCIN